MSPPPPKSTLFPYTTLFRSVPLPDRPAPPGDDPTPPEGSAAGAAAPLPWPVSRSGPGAPGELAAACSGSAPSPAAADSLCAAPYIEPGASDRGDAGRSGVSLIATLD